MPDETAVAATDAAADASAPAPAPAPVPAPDAPSTPDAPAPIGDPPPSTEEWQRLGAELVAERTADDAALAALRNDWGTEFDANLGLAQRLVGEVAAPELVAAFDRSGLAGNPFLLRAVAEVARRLYGPNGAAASASMPPSGRNTGRIRTRLDELHALQFHDDPTQRDAYRSAPVQGELERLYAALYGHAPVVGRESRVA